jgi:hypothetical protein
MDLNPGDLNVDIGGASCVMLTRISDNQLKCVLPPGLGGSRKVVAYVGGQSSPPDDMTFAYEAPVKPLTPRYMSFGLCLRLVLETCDMTHLGVPIPFVTFYCVTGNHQADTQSWHH